MQISCFDSFCTSTEKQSLVEKAASEVHVSEVLSTESAHPCFVSHVLPQAMQSFGDLSKTLCLQTVKD